MKFDYNRLFYSIHLVALLSSLNFFVNGPKDILQFYSQDYGLLLILISVGFLTFSIGYNKGYKLSCVSLVAIYINYFYRVGYVEPFMELALWSLLLNFFFGATKLSLTLTKIYLCSIYFNSALWKLRSFNFLDMDETVVAIKSAFVFSNYYFDFRPVISIFGIIKSNAYDHFIFVSYFFVILIQFSSIFLLFNSKVKREVSVGLLIFHILNLLFMGIEFSPHVLIALFLLNFILYFEARPAD